MGDFFPRFASGFHGDLLVRFLQFPESCGLGNGLVDVRAHARELVLVILELFPLEWFIGDQARDMFMFTIRRSDFSDG